MPLPAKHSPALAAHGLRAFLTASDGESCSITVPVHYIETLLKERDALLEALKSCEATLLYGLEYGPKEGLLPVVQAALSSARGA